MRLTREEIKNNYNKFNTFISSVFNIIKSKNILTLDLSQVSGDDYDKRIIKIITPYLYDLLENNNSIIRLDLSKNHLKNDIVKNIFNSLLKNNNLKLENINLSYTKISEIYFIIDFLLQNKTIKSINLSNN